MKRIHTLYKNKNTLYMHIVLSGFCVQYYYITDYHHHVSLEVPMI